MLNSGTDEETLGQKLMQTPGNIYRSVRGAIQGQQDPQYKDTPSYEDELTPSYWKGSMAEGPDAIHPDEHKLARITAQGDQELANILKNKLGDRFVSASKDANGYDLITYRSKVDGKERTVYVNKPGLDIQDVDRFIANALPYMGGAGVAGSAVRGAGLLTRMATQGATGGATSVGMDVGAGQQGSEMAPDAWRAAGAAAGGAVGEPLAAGLGKVAQWFYRRQLLNASGNLTTKGAQIARQNGIDPAELSAAAVREFAGDVSRGANPAHAARKAGVESRGVKGTVGQYTDDLEQQILESDMRRGRFGSPAASVMRDFDERQIGQVEKSVNQYSTDEFGHQLEVPAGAGQELQSGVRGRFQERKAKVDQSFEQYDPEKLKPTPVDKAMLLTRMKRLGIDDRNLYFEIADMTPESHPQAWKAIEDLDKFSGAIPGGLKTKARESIGAPETDVSFEQLRRRLSIYREAAAKGDNSADLRLTSRVTDLYNKYLIDVASNIDNPLDTMKYLRAIDMHRDLMRAFGTRGDPALDPGGRFMQDLIHKDSTPERIIDKLLGSGPNAPREAVPILQRLKETLGTDSPEWGILKATAMYKLTTRADKPLEAGKMVDQANLLLAKNSVYRELFDPEELKSLARYFEDINVVRRKDLPSVVKSKEVGELARVRQDGFLRFFFRKMGTRETFRGRPFNSVFWNMLAKSKLSTPIYNIQERAGEKLANQAVSGELPLRVRPRFTTGLGSAAGAEYGD